MTTAVRLRIPKYQTIPTGPGGTQNQDLIFALSVNRIQKDIQDGAQVLVFPAFQSELLCYSMIRMVITLNGTVLEDGVHTAHPLTTAVEHVPDFIDMEEMAVGWSNQALPGVDLALLPELQIQIKENTYRVYKGAVTKLTLTRTEGKTQVDFALVFAVTWSETNPTLREWST